MAHVKHINMRNQIYSIRSDEGTLPENAVGETHSMAEVNEILKSEKKPLIPPIKINEEVHMPYGFGFDEVIQENIEKQEQYRNFRAEKLMDKLTQQQILVL